MNAMTSALLFLPTLLSAAQPSRVETRVEALAMGGTLRVSQVDGSLDVQGWDRPEVAIRAEFFDGSRASRATLEVRRVGEALEIQVKEPRRPHLIFGFHRGATCNLTLMVPRRLSMAAYTVDGALDVKNLDGYADLRTVDGSIRVANLSGEVHANAVDGRIEARDLNARIKGGSVDGNILLERVAGGVELKTVDGSITASELDGWGEGIHLSTVDGGIQIRLGAAKGNLEAKSVDGSIRIQHPALIVQETRKAFLRGRIEGRSQDIRLRTIDGDIQIN